MGPSHSRNTGVGVAHNIICKYKYEHDCSFILVIHSPISILSVCVCSREK